MENAGQPSLVQVINTIAPDQLPTVPAIAARFKKMFSFIHPFAAPAQVEAFYEAEKFHFVKTITDNPKLVECTRMSLYGCWMDVAVNGLSFDPSFKHLYMVPFSTKVGNVWEKRAQLQISGYGELVLRINQGQIKYVDNPVLVYEGDLFKYGNRAAGAYVEHETTMPRKSSKIVACYLKITRTDGTIDYKVLTQEDMDRFKAYAKKGADGTYSTAWTDGLGGLWQSKCIKHSFKNYPKVRTGKFTELQTNTDDAEAKPLIEAGTMRVPDKIDYSIPEDDGLASFVEINDDEFAQGNVEQGNTVTKQDDDF